MQLRILHSLLYTQYRNIYAVTDPSFTPVYTVQKHLCIYGYFIHSCIHSTETFMHLWILHSLLYTQYRNIYAFMDPSFPPVYTVQKHLCIYGYLIFSCTPNKDRFLSNHWRNAVYLGCNRNID